MKETVIAELLKLSPAERIQLAEDLWDSVAAQPESLPALSDDHNLRKSSVATRRTHKTQARPSPGRMYVHGCGLASDDTAPCFPVKSRDRTR
jgi:putative addiction module component (TIGR02574 family)